MNRRDESSWPQFLPLMMLNDLPSCWLACECRLFSILLFMLTMRLAFTIFLMLFIFSGLRCRALAFSCCFSVRWMDLCLIFSTPLLDFVATFLNLPCAIPLLLLLLLCRYKVLSRKLCVLSKITNKQENNKASFPFILLVLLVLLLLVVVKYK